MDDNEPLEQRKHLLSWSAACLRDRWDPSLTVEVSKEVNSMRDIFILIVCFLLSILFSILIMSIFNHR